MQMPRHPQYFASRQTAVQKGICEDSEIGNEQMKNSICDKSACFPTLKLMTSYNFGPIEVDPAKKSDMFLPQSTMCWHNKTRAPAGKAS